MIYRLRDNLGEPQELGFGLDLKGFQTTVQFTDMQVSVFLFSVLKYCHMIPTGSFPEAIRSN